MYRASQKDVPDFNNLLLEFNIMQVNRISIDGKENLPNFFQAHWLDLAHILSENAVERSQQTCLHENQEHKTIYVLHSSPFTLAVSWRTTVEPTLRKINFEILPSKAHISQQDTLIRFCVIIY
jgi:hypothetical protein